MPALPLPNVIRTERLALRPWAAEDAPQLVEALGESVDHLLPWIPWATAAAPSIGQVETLLSRWKAERESGANFIYAACRATDERLVGGIGLYARVGPGRLEVGYWMRRTESGKGLATEAARAVTSAGFALPHVSGLEIHTHPSNLPSRRIPEKLGYRFLGVRETGERSSAVYECRSDGE